MPIAYTILSSFFKLFELIPRILQLHTALLSPYLLQQHLNALNKFIDKINDAG